MGRASRHIVVFLVILYAVSIMITASGVGAALDINPEVAGGEEIDAANESARNISPSQGTQDTLFSMFTSTASSYEIVYQVVFYGPMMLKSLGVPDFILLPVFAPMYIIVAADFIHLLTGRDT